MYEKACKKTIALDLARYASFLRGRLKWHNVPNGSPNGKSRGQEVSVTGLYSSVSFWKVRNWKRATLRVRSGDGRVKTSDLHLQNYSKLPNDRSGYMLSPLQEDDTHRIHPHLRGMWTTFFPRWSRARYLRVLSILKGCQMITMHLRTRTGRQQRGNASDRTLMWASITARQSSWPRKSM